MSAFLPWLALALVGVAIATAIGALVARSLFVTCVHLIACGVSAAAATALLRGGDGALALALFAAAWAPVLLLAAMLLSGRAAKAPARRAWPLATLAGAVAAACAIWWPLLELRSAAPAIASEPVSALSFWLAPIVFAATVACVGALGYGERGALGAQP